MKGLISQPSKWVAIVVSEVPSVPCYSIDRHLSQPAVPHARLAWLVPLVHCHGRVRSTHWTLLPGRCPGSKPEPKDGRQGMTRDNKAQQGDSQADSAGKGRRGKSFSWARNELIPANETADHAPSPLGLFPGLAPSSSRLGPSSRPLHHKLRAPEALTINHKTTRL